ncbi:hypothetical protein [Desulfotalea psychrophila]|uniref:Phage protein n=1 Tax=Desulfotalea psychrophila (strain LSv54 / DSM 12343) TaxID=177439 RepID=Q6ALM1_DESPS|nr:hypothetical protein [Desulfotalea psychrophila]CAG36754.1 conserved hypothetical protein [Desulfotalea psychrophila LSv54]
MIDRTFIEKIEEMSKPNFREESGVVLSNKRLHRLARPLAMGLEVHSLQAIADYANNLTEEGVAFVVNVLSPSKVVLLSGLDPDHRDRETFLESSCAYDPFVFGRYYDVEEFIVSLQAQFVQDEVIGAILKMVGNMVTRSDVGLYDDGVTQIAEVKTGLANVEKVALPNPVSIAPYRTFPELEQPCSNFVLRLTKDHSCALFEADGGAWKIEAIEKIADFFRTSIICADIAILHSL